MPAVSDFITAKKIKLLSSLLAFFTDKSGFVGVIEIAKPWLPLTRELSSKARLRERKDRGFMRSYFSPSVFLLTQKSTSLVRGRQDKVCLQFEAPLCKGGCHGLP